MKRTLLCMLVVSVILSMMATFTLLGCERTAPEEEVTEETAGEAAQEEIAGEAAQEETAGEAAQEEIKIGISIDTMNHPWRSGLVRDAEAEAAKYDYVNLIVTDAQGQSLKQISDIEDLIAQQIDILMLSPHEAEPVTPAANEAYDGGIPVIVLDREIANDKYTCFIGASNVEIGEKAGEFIAEYLDGEGNIVEMMGIPGASPTRDRSEPMRTVFEDYPDIEIVASPTANYEQLEALNAMEAVLQANPEGTIDLVYCHNDSMALGVIQAIEATGRTEIQVVGVDAQKEALEAIIDGKMLATFTYPFPGAEGIKVAIKIFNGETVDKRILMESTMITSENVEEYYDPEKPFAYGPPFVFE